MVDAILGSPAHIIATMRSKMEYVQEKDANGKTTIRKIGLAPVNVLASSTSSPWSGIWTWSII